MEKVICDHTLICSDPLCGGAQSHEPCSECGNCPRHKDAKCIDFNSDEGKRIALNIKVAK